ncbi:hypothetical protein DVH24_021536 [Malus domestica]|uniref:DUF7865 domain-containing protein n=1 Tax=Malus domestica TaxID=3750 RepID=A0A498K1D7_MALDO|nr:hypothetical protein DVH24_021536 [Malus domestica]
MWDHNITPPFGRLDAHAGNHVAQSLVTKSLGAHTPKAPSSSFAYTFRHVIETAQKLLVSIPYNQLLIWTFDSFSSLLLFVIGFLLLMVSFMNDHDFQSFFAKGCTVHHVFMALWRCGRIWENGPDF